MANRDGHFALANELMATRRVGPLVSAEIMAGLKANARSREADEDFLRRLEGR